MAAGKIVITTRAGIKGIEAKPETHYLLANSPEDFVRAVKWCFDNKAAAVQMADKAIALIKDKYDQQKVIGRVISEMEALLKELH